MVFSIVLYQINKVVSSLFYVRKNASKKLVFNKYFRSFFRNTSLKFILDFQAKKNPENAIILRIFYYGWIGVSLLVYNQLFCYGLISYSNFYKGIFDHIEVNHLWFIENLFYLSVLSIPLVLFVRSKHAALCKNAITVFTSKRLGMFAFVLPLIIIKIVTKHYYPEDDKAITNLSSTLFYGYFFVMGILFAGTPTVWESLKKYRKTNLLLTVMAILVFYAYYFIPNDIASSYWELSTRWCIWYGVSALVSWSVICTLLGYGQIWLSKPSALLTKCNEAIYPFYILHQTVLIVIGYYVIQQPWNIPVKLLVLALSSFIVIVFIYRYIVYPFKILRFLFGMKNK